MIEFVFGYGSLINSASRSKTGSSGASLPVRVTGLQRSWNFVDHEARLAALGVVLEEDSVANGMLIAFSAYELLAFDRREEGYTRTRLDPTRVSSCTGGEVPEGDIWVYIPKEFGRPSPDTPIVQSYVDVVLAGCLEQSESFAAEFVRTTALWDNPWIDDRTMPRYQRALTDASPSLYLHFDRLLRECGLLSR